MKTKHLLGFAFAFAAAFFAPKAAQATTCSLPTTFVTGMVLTAANMNANPVALLSCLGNLDFNNVGGAGFYASQILPTSTAQATFGGSIPYTFPNGIISNSPLKFNSAATSLASLALVNANLACDGSTDDTAALNTAIANVAAQGGGTVVVTPKTAGVACRILGAVVVPYTGTLPVQQPIRLTGLGPGWGGGEPASAANGGTILDMRYTGADALHPAKIDTRGTGHLEIDHLTITDNGTDNFLFLQTTNTTLHIHDNQFIGNPANSGQACIQDAIRLGANGIIGTGSMANGGYTLTASTSIFNAGMVGLPLAVANAEPGGVRLPTSIATYISPTQVTLANPAGVLVSSQPFTIFDVQTTDATAPFQGYGTLIQHNDYQHIQRAVIFGTYAKNVVVKDEHIMNNSGSSMTYGAPYYFDPTYDQQDGNSISGATIEMTYYPYMVSLQTVAFYNNFYANGGYDNQEGVGHITQGWYYFGTNAEYNTVTMGMYDPALVGVYTTGPGAPYNTLISDGTGGNMSNFPGAGASGSQFFAPMFASLTGTLNLQASSGNIYMYPGVGSGVTIANNYGSLAFTGTGNPVVATGGSAGYLHLVTGNAAGVGIALDNETAAATVLASFQNQGTQKAYVSGTGGFVGTTGTFSGALSGASVTGSGGDFPLVYRDSAQFTNKPIIQMSQLTASGSGGTATYNFPVAYVAPPICTTGKFGAGSTSNDAYLSSLATTAVSINNPGSASETMNVICVGQ